MLKKNYKTPFGVIEVFRNVYQSASGGKTYVPLDAFARIISNFTPKLAKTVTHKHTVMNTRSVVSDLKENHSLPLTNKSVKRITDSVAEIANAKEDTWVYQEPSLDDSVEMISLGLDGTCMYLIEENDRGWREAMVGTIALYNKAGVRLHTIYFSCSPEYEKKTFRRLMRKEVQKIMKTHPNATYVGIADGAQDNWTTLREYTSVNITDFWHATEYLKGAATAIFKNEVLRKKWLDLKCHELKHNKGSAIAIRDEMEALLNEGKLSKEKIEKIQKAITYFSNQSGRMNYSSYLKKGYPIGSGVTEAACKTVIKTRLCQAGMRWKVIGSSAILALRSLNLSKRWSSFWSKINQYGISA